MLGKESRALEFSQLIAMKIPALIKKKSLRILIMGQTGVGKTAMVVRFLTSRFIGDYDTREQMYSKEIKIDNDSTINLQLLDATGKIEDENQIQIMESNIKWAEVFILVYSVTDKCSFDDINRLKFLITFYKKRKKIYKDESFECPVLLVANKSDRNDRMVSREEGLKLSRDIGCASFREISVMENIEEVTEIFHDCYRFWKSSQHVPKLKRSKSDSVRVNESSTEKIGDKKLISSNCNVADPKIAAVKLSQQNDTFDEPFRSRAKTDGNLIMKKWKLHSHLMSSSEETTSLALGGSMNRRNSISMRGHKISFCTTNSISEDE